MRSRQGGVTRSARQALQAIAPLLVLGACGAAQAQVSFAAAANSSTTGISTVSYPLTIPAGANRFLIVSAQLGSNCAGSSPTVASITYAGVALTPITSVVGTPCGPATRSEQWQLVAPATGSNNVDVTLSAAAPSLHSGVMAFTGVDQTTPVRAFASASGSTAAASVTVASAANDIVVNTVGEGRLITGPGAGQTQRFLKNGSNGTTLDNSAGSTAPGAASVTMTWTFGGGADEWQSISSSVRPPTVPSRLAFTSPSRTFTAGACPGAAGAITVQLQDGAGTPANAGVGGLAVTATSSSTGSVTWYTDSACATTATGGAFTIPNGASTVSLFYRDTRAGTPSVSLANGASLANPVPQTHTVNPGALSDFLVETAAVKPNWFDAAWGFRKKITLDNSKVGPGGVTDFPVLVSLPSDGDLASGARPDGYDVLFTASDGTTKLSHEIERFVGATGNLVAWVRAPVLSSAAPTDVYLYFGNSGAADQEDAVGVWSANFQGVWHLKEPTGTTVADSTSHANGGTKPSAATPGPGTGVIAGAQVFDGANSYVSMGDIGGVSTAGMSVAFWANFNALPGSWANMVGKANGVGTTNTFQYVVGADAAGGNVTLSTSDATGQTNGMCSYSLSGNLNTWLHLVAVWSTDFGWCKLYVNGAVATAQSVAVKMNPSTTHPFELGRGYSPPTLDATLDEVQVLNVAVTGDWVATAYRNQGSPSTFYGVAGAEPAEGGAIGPQTAGTPFSVRITARDAYGNTLTNFTGTVDLTSTGALSAGGGTSAAFVAGVLTSASVTASSPGTFTLAVTNTAGAETGTSTAFTVTAGAFAKLQVLVPGETAAPGTPSGKTGSPAAQSAGTPFTVSVQAVDANWNPVSSTDTVGLTSSDANAILPANTALVAGNQPLNVTLQTAGTATVTVTDVSDGTKTADTSPPITVTGGAASQLVFTTPSRTFAAGGCPGAAAAITVQLQDSYGAAANAGVGGQAFTASSTSTGTVTWYADSACGTTAGGGAFTIPSGASSVSLFYVDTRAGAPSVSLANGSGLTNPAPQTHTVIAGPASQVAFIVVPTYTTAGASIAPAVQVAVQDRQGNPVTSSTASIALALGPNPGGGALSGTTPVNAVAGVATFSNLSIDKVGVGYTLEASSTGLTGATSAPFDITEGAAAKLAFVVNPVTTIAGATVSPAVQVDVEDAAGNLLPSAAATVSVTLGTNPGAATLGGGGTVAATGGVASFADLTLDKAGVGYSLIASAPGLGSATSAAFDITAGAASRLAFVVQPPDGVLGLALSPAVQVELRDAQGNSVSGASTTVVLALQDNPGMATLSGTLSAAAVGGVATFADLALNRKGIGLTLKASAPATADTTSDAFDVAPSPGKSYLAGCGCQSAGGASVALWSLLGLLALARRTQGRAAIR